MDVSRRNEVVVGVVLPIIALGALFAWGATTDQTMTCIALMAVVPMFAASFARVPLTLLVGLVAIAAAVGASLMASGSTISDALVPIAAVTVSAAVAVVVSQYRSHPTAGRGSVSASPASTHKGVQFQLQTQADTDAMTGLLNRRGAVRTLGARNSGSSRVVAFLDCDQLRDVNDQYGTEVGDEFLQAIAGRLRNQLPAHDTVARWDGDEYLLVISANAEAAAPALDRVMKSIGAYPIRTASGPIPSSISVGAALWEPNQDLEGAIARAGRALFAAKQQGRGHTVVDSANTPATPENPE